MADYFIYDWNDGSKTEILLPTEKGTGCHTGSVSAAMNEFSGYMLAEAGNSQDLQDVESYILAALPVMQRYYNIASDIKHYWDVIEIDCAKWQNWCCPANWYCYKHSRFCYKSENTLEEYYYHWKTVPGDILDDIASIENYLLQVTAQIYTDQQQALQEAIINQMIAETNSIMSIVAYENEQRELAITRKKTADIFAPMIILLTIVGVALFLYKS